MCFVYFCNLPLHFLLTMLLARYMTVTFPAQKNQVCIPVIFNCFSAFSALSDYGLILYVCMYVWVTIMSLSAYSDVFN